MDRTLDPRDQSPQEFLARAGELSLSLQNARRWLAFAIGKGESSLSECGRHGILPRRLVDTLNELPRLHFERHLVSNESNFRKLVFRTVDDLNVESVIIPLHRLGAYSICLSSQIGCVMECSYCSTGRVKTRRDLKTWEIVDQFVQAREIVRREGGRVTGAVFMGMGEPFLNYDRVMSAAELLSYPVESAIGAKAITVSTAGLVSGIERFTSENRKFRLSISLGATDEKRKLLMPVASRYPVARVMETARRYAESRRTRVMLSYVCVGGFNVSEEDARALAALIGDTQVRLDLIDVDDRTGKYAPPGKSELNQFRDALRRHVGQPVVRRYSGGSDIMAACGTLGGRPGQKPPNQWNL